ncbi:hypothetical protein ANAPC5_01260 [Anaplasma phagocytophilum]|nr:hypothetical protein ANAPC5_01260 [Anaplasma phagocytophilum]
MGRRKSGCCTRRNRSNAKVKIRTLAFRLLTRSTNDGVTKAALVSSASSNTFEFESQRPALRVLKRSTSAVETKAAGFVPSH